MDDSTFDLVQSQQASQPYFIEYAIKHQCLVSVFLVSGLQLKGILVGTDEQSLFLKDANNTQMIYKHSVATIVLKFDH